MTKPKEMSKLTTPFTSQIPFLLTFPPNGHRTAKTMKSVHSAHFTSYIYSLFLFLSQKLFSVFTSFCPSFTPLPSLFPPPIKSLPPSPC
ncbi:unnamed protein product [Meloidogyne enterolobii]|uniref:Uncharacterized protein n=1 Tax=Meloidogyne enterolobii TaxID=390850 RepID=A0ACB0ZGA5_MELEN